MKPSEPIAAREMAKKNSWLAAAEIIGVAPRTMRRCRERLEEHGCNGLRDRYIAEFNPRLKVPAAERGTAFRACVRRDLEWIFTVQTGRVFSKDNTAAIKDRWWQIEKCRWRYSPHVAGRYQADGTPVRHCSTAIQRCSPLSPATEEEGCLKPKRTDSKADDNATPSSGTR